MRIKIRYHGNMPTKKQQIDAWTKIVGKLRKDWHSEAIKAELRKFGWTLARVSTENGYYRNEDTDKLKRSWPCCQFVIGEIRSRLRTCG
jgi:hypothetical protein